jgi:hypothetical protein
MRSHGTLLERIAARIDATGGPDACHIWTGGKSQNGHPCISYKDGARSVRRVIWESKHGPLAKTRWVTTTCRVALCVNPAHLKLRAVTDDAARFWEKVDRRGPNECWPFIGYCEPRGYGRFSPLGGERTRQAHRVAWELGHGREIPKSDVEIVVMHSCDNPPCCNPAHLSLGTDAENQADCVAKGRKSRGPEHGRRAQEGRDRARAAREALQNRT